VAADGHSKISEYEREQKKKKKFKQTGGMFLSKGNRKLRPARLLGAGIGNQKKSITAAAECFRSWVCSMLCCVC